jgi:ERF superfamily
MHRSSEKIAALAAALAKAQADLVNPEKSLVGTIESSGQRLFRYASLASGLEIVRKTLGQHEIATMQTTAIDQSAGTVTLTTVLAHASGEWVASDWPVCALADTVTPHRMGAALTYARRYALFTLVGIAGEDDVDAPDLAAPTKISGEVFPTPTTTGSRLRSNGRGGMGPATGHRSSTGDRIVTKPVLEPQASQVLRDQLLAELKTLDTNDAVTVWAHRVLGAKNSLTSEDARSVEDAFRVKMAALGSDGVKRHDVDSSLVSVTSKAIDKSALGFPEPRRIRDKEHIKFVTRQPCLLCGRSPSDAHHLRFAQRSALGRKVSDEFTVPLCRAHHREVHRCGDEAAWWTKADIDSIASARALWLNTHPLPISPEDFVAGSVGAARAAGSVPSSHERTTRSASDNRVPE